MAALDFGMALARGMLPKAETAQKDLMDLAGGRNVFKSEDWWNKAVDKQISSGYRESEKGTEYMTKSGQYVLGERTVSRVNSNMYGIGGGTSISYQAPKNALITGYKQPSYSGGFWGLGYGGGGGPSPIYKTREVDVYGQSGRKDFTAGELSNITKSAKRGVEQIKRTSAESQAARKKRGTGGVLAKARLEGEAPSTGLPALGEGGLGITGSILGGGIKL